MIRATLGQIFVIFFLLSPASDARVEQRVLSLSYKFTLSFSEVLDGHLLLENAYVDVAEFENRVVVVAMTC
jgi:hypothetical protein